MHSFGGQCKTCSRSHFEHVCAISEGSVERGSRGPGGHVCEVLEISANPSLGAVQGSNKPEGGLITLLEKCVVKFGRGGSFYAVLGGRQAAHLWDCTVQLTWRTTSSTA